MTDDEVGPLYCAIMEELKARVQTMGEIAHGIRRPTSSAHHRHNVFFFEGLYLQLRKVCELLAIAVLTAQTLDERFQKANLLAEYRADKLFKAVSRINPVCFPRPIQGGNWKPGATQLVWEHPPVFTAKDITSLYNTCDERMHAGKLRDFLRGRKTDLRQDLVKEWVEKLMTGLANHIIALPEAGRSMIVQMVDSENGQVNCRFASLALHDR